MAATQRMYRVVWVAALGLAALAAAPAFKHTRLERSEPAADSTVTVAPRAIKLWFSEPVQLSVTTVRITGVPGATITLSPARMDTLPHAPVILDVHGVWVPGRYTAAWRTMSRDGHPVSGTFAFTFAAPAPPTR